MTFAMGGVPHAGPQQTSDEQETDLPTKQVSQLHIRDTTPPDSLRRTNIPGHLTQATRNAPIPTWGQIKTLCHQA